jgi:hypothetical protein
MARHLKEPLARALSCLVGGVARRRNAASSLTHGCAMLIDEDR